MASGSGNAFNAAMQAQWCYVMDDNSELSSDDDNWMIPENCKLSSVAKSLCTRCFALLSMKLEIAGKVYSLKYVRTSALRSNQLAREILVTKDLQVRSKLPSPLPAISNLWVPFYLFKSRIPVSSVILSINGTLASAGMANVGEEDLHTDFVFIVGR
jgi:hypothetical protein